MIISDPNPGTPTPVEPVISNYGGSGATSSVVIDLHSTKVRDNLTGEETTLDTFFREVTTDGLIMNTEAHISDGSETGAFDFRFDSTQWGAGTAFLQED